MKKLAALTTLSLLAMLIVLPGTCFVNCSRSTFLIAEGSPLPWPAPPKISGNAILTAEGSPLPWPAPPKISGNTILTAEGSPLPWPAPPLSPVAV
jgi:hypothetical protein